MKKLILLACIILCAGSASARRVGVYCFFADGANAVYEDENLKVMIGIDGGHPCWIVANKSDRTLYIDKGNSFSYKNNTPTCLFTNASYTSGKEKNSGVGINLGSVANAVGIGGIAGTLMNGMNVGGGRTTQNSTTIQEQRVLALAPKAVYKLCDWTIDASDFAQIGFRPRKIGRTWHFENTNTPYSVRGVLRYSQTEDFAETQDITVSNYVNDIVLDKRQSLRKFKKARVVNNPIYTNRSFCVFLEGQNYAATAYLVGGCLAVGVIAGAVAASA